jgi:hypothetical protein
MTVCCPGWIGTIERIHTAVPPDDGPSYARNMYRLTKYIKNMLCIKLDFLYTIISRSTANETLKKYNYTYLFLKNPINNELFVPVCRWSYRAEKCDLFPSGQFYTTKMFV